MATAPKKRILIVDDEEGMLASLSDYLDFEGFEVAKARTGKQALRKVDRFDPHIVVLDVATPGMGGVGFLKGISASDGHPKYPVIVLSARANLKGFFETLDVDGFLCKPCERSVLLEKIEDTIARHEHPHRHHAAAGARILLGEDDAMVASSLKSFFAMLGHEIEVADTGPDVIEKATACKPDIVLVKDILTHMNGEAVAALLKAMPATRQTPVVLYDGGLGEVTDSEVRHAVSADVVRHVRSSQPADLLQAVTRVLSRP